MKHKNWFWGLFLLLAGVWIIAWQTQAFESIGVMTALGAILVAALLVHSIFRRNFFGISISLGLAYYIFQNPLNLPEISFWLLLLAAVLFGSGLSVLFKRARIKQYDKFINSHGGCTDSENINNNHPSASVSFGSSSKYLHADCLRSGQFSVSFGEMNLYFGQTTLSPEGADIQVDCSFAAMQLYIPRNWPIENKIYTSLAGVEKDHRQNEPTSADGPVLRLTGNVQFGSVEIHYI